MSKADKPNDWLTSKEVEKALRVDSCELMHLRLEGRIGFQKKGNAFLYAEKDVKRLHRQRASHGD